MFPKYSFVLPAYKATFLHEAIDSILCQSYTDFELIIVNDDSPENLDSIVNSYDDSRIIYYKNERNIGGKDLVAQWNHCLGYATGEYVILASDDDIYFSQYLEKMDFLVNKYKQVNVFRPRLQMIDTNGVVTYTFSEVPEILDEVNYMYYWMSGKVGSGVPYFIFKRSALLDYGGFINFPSAWGSDDATVIDLSKNGIGFHPEILFSFRMSGLNISTLYNNKYQLRLKLKALCSFEKWLKYKAEELNNIYMNDKSHYICANSDEFMRGNTLYVLGCSSLIAILSNLKLIFRLKSMKTMRGIYCILLMLGRRLLAFLRNVKR